MIYDNDNEYPVGNVTPTISYDEVRARYASRYGGEAANNASQQDLVNFARDPASGGTPNVTLTGTYTPAPAPGPGVSGDNFQVTKVSPTTGKGENAVEFTATRTAIGGTPTTYISLGSYSQLNAEQQAAAKAWAAANNVTVGERPAWQAPIPDAFEKAGYASGDMGRWRESPYYNATIIQLSNAPVTVIPDIGAASFQQSRNYLSQFPIGTPIRFDNSPTMYYSTGRGGLMESDGDALTGWGPGSGSNVYVVGTVRGEVRPTTAPISAVTSPWSTEKPAYTPSIITGMGGSSVSDTQRPTVAGFFGAGDSSMTLGGREYSDPLNAMGIYNIGKAFVDVTQQGYSLITNPLYNANLRNNPAQQVGLKMITGATSMLSGAAGGLIMGIGAGLGLAEAGVQDVAKGNTDYAIIPKTFSEGFSGGILGRPVTETNSYTIPYHNVDANGVDTIIGTKTVNQTSTTQMPNLGEQLVTGLAPSAFTKNPDYVMAAGELVGAGLLFGYGARGLVKGKGTGKVVSSIDNAVDIKMGGGGVKLGMETEPRVGVGLKEVVTDNARMDFRVVETSSGELGNRAINMETGAKLPGQMTSIGGVEGIPTGDSIPKPQGIVAKVFDSYARTTPEYYQPGEGSFNYQPRLNVYDISKQPGAIETNIGFAKSIQSAYRVTLRDLTEPDMARTGERPPAGLEWKYKPNEFSRELDIAPKTIEEQFAQKPIAPEKGHSVSISDEKGGVELKGMTYKYTEDNYLAVSPEYAVAKLGFDLVVDRVPKMGEVEGSARGFEYRPKWFVAPTVMAAGLVNITPVTTMYKTESVLDSDITKDVDRLTIFEKTNPATTIDQRTRVYEDQDIRTDIIVGTREAQMTSVIEIGATAYRPATMTTPDVFTRMSPKPPFAIPAIPSFSPGEPVSNKKKGHRGIGWRNVILNPVFMSDDAGPDYRAMRKNVKSHNKKSKSTAKRGKSKGRR